MQKMKFPALILSLLLVMSLFGACGGSGGEDSDEPTELYVVNWEAYATDDPALMAAFEEEYNCTIVNTYMSSEEDLLTRLRTAAPGEIDVCLPNVTILTSAVEEGLLAEIDISQLSNFDSLFERFQTQEECMKDGKYYAIPWVWGSTSIAYNTDVFSEPPASMEVFWDENLSGQLTFRDDFVDSIMVAALVAGQDPNHPDDLDAIKDLLIQQKSLNRTYWQTGDEFSRLFANGQVSVGLMWSGQAAFMKLEGEPIGFTIPDEGAVGWVDNWGIAANSEKQELALAFIDYVIGYDVQYNWAANGGPAPANQEAAEAIDPEYAAAAAMDEVSLNKLHFMEYLSEEDKAVWNELWTEVKAY